MHDELMVARFAWPAVAAGQAVPFGLGLVAFEPGSSALEPNAAKHRLGWGQMPFCVRLVGEMPVDILRLKLAGEIIDEFAVKP